MDEVYLFKDGTNKFTPPPGKNPTDNLEFKYKYFSSPSCAVSEFPLQMFSTWFQDLGLSKGMSHNKREDGNEIWVYKVVLLYPTSVHSNKAKVTRCKLATEAAGQFYSTVSNSTEADFRSIHHAVQLDPSIMVIGHAKKFIIGCADSVVISCITYQNGIGDETGLSMVLWLLIAASKAQKPSLITSWRRQGFGQLMLIMLMKQ
jgi:hypothetical protein